MKHSAFSLLLALGATLTLTECATIGPPQPPSLDLPKPPQDLRTTRKGNRVTLTWTMPNSTTDRQTIRSVGPTLICRSQASEMAECGTPVGQTAPAAVAPNNSAAKSKNMASFTDQLPSALDENSSLGFVTYAVEVENRNGRGAGLSNLVRVVLAPTLPPPGNFQAHVTREGVVLSWSKISPPEHAPAVVQFMVRVHRQEEGSPQQTIIGEVGIEGEPKLTDADIEWEKTYDYRGETVTVVREPNGSEVQVEGEDTPELKVLTRDVFPPTVPSGLQAVYSGPGQQPFVDLVWAPVTDPDLAGYNVYRNEQGTEPAKLNSEPVKMPAYRDTGISSGKRYFYSVTSVDVRGNESAKSEEASELVP